MADSASAAARGESGQNVWRHATSAAYVGSAGRVVVLDLDRPELPPYVFEGPAADIWAAVDGTRSETEMAAELAEAFKAPVDVVTADVRQFVNRLRELGLLVGTGG